MILSHDFYSLCTLHIYIVVIRMCYSRWLSVRHISIMHSLYSRMQLEIYRLDIDYIAVKNQKLDIDSISIDQILAV